MTAPAPSQSAVAPSGEIPTGVRIAATLCWVVGIVTILVAFAVGIPAISSSGGL
jgi:hypothetical protein